MAVVTIEILAEDDLGARYTLELEAVREARGLYCALGWAPATRKRLDALEGARTLRLVGAIRSEALAAEGDTIEFY